MTLKDAKECIKNKYPKATVTIPPSGEVVR